jgi:hypothetical protein
MDELLKTLGQLQEELKRTMSANEMIEAAKLASERIAPIILKLDALLKELNEVNFPQTLKDLKEIVYSSNRAISDVKDGIKDIKTATSDINTKLQKIIDQSISIADKHSKQITNHFTKLDGNLEIYSKSNKKKQNVLIIMSSFILFSVILLIILYLIR